MIGEEGQARFKAQYNQFGITLRMSSEDVLSIAVDNSHTLERYSRDINQEYIMQQDTSFQRIFEGVKDIYDYLRAGTNEVVVDREFLVFNYRYSRSRVKRIRFQLIREDIDRVELANRKMEKMQEHFTAQLLQKDVEIKELKQKYEEMAQILEEIKGQIRAEKAKTRELAETLKANTEKTQAVAHSISLVPVEEKSKQMIMESPEQVKILEKIDHHPDNAHKQYYSLKNLTARLTRITRIGEDRKWYNFVNKCEVLPNQKAKYSLTFKTTSKILIGFCTEKGLGNINNFKHAESAYYQCYSPAYLCEGGSEKRTDVVIVVGETVECVADLASCKLSWWKNGSQFAECAVPAGMRNKPIYISILLVYAGEEVDLCI